ncbi:hypothetical protein, variant [Verruconis gallopava]|uniref:VWFA domain-containing protein n=1 Tax=Verruconis gallopava TaxID=253628 RepID=A0A0D2AD13_9PEZI|nr:uncharacterized protein PV09_04003 [Verruconis gallopava]XP_016214688.1 hypothetical protein, variant [Verruconis gallopava]KIW04818.1 hypothetical protein PV09_04003 [Verruconis gallopava]KIW04819.1 hypothetical protein, variant [Verruconis gallopava]
MERNGQGIFGTLKSKISHKKWDKHSSGASQELFSTPIATQASNLFAQTSQPTRRPIHRSASRTPDEPPPAYTPTVAYSHAQATGSANDSDSDPYAFLSTFDTIFVIDDSGSMAGRSWTETQHALEAITPICTAHDADGIDLYFLNAPDSVYYRNVKDSSAVREIFSMVRPRGQTPLGTKLNQILKPYLARFEKNPETTKPINIIVITDGEPSDDPESVIIYAARKLNKLDASPWQVGIQFFQVGREPGAKEYLEELDDGLSDKCGGRDMVDTQAWKNEDDKELNGTGILKAVLGSVNKRLDNKKSDRPNYC